MKTTTRESFTYSKCDEILRENNINNVSIRFATLSTALARAREVRYNNRIIAREIVFNKLYINANNTEESIINTIKHEIAHIIAGGRNGHNFLWVEACKMLGCEARVYGSPDETILKRYNYKCPHCDYGYNSNIARRTNVACKECCNKYNNGNYSSDYKLIKTKII